MAGKTKVRVIKKKEEIKKVESKIEIKGINKDEQESEDEAETIKKSEEFIEVNESGSVSIRRSLPSVEEEIQPVRRLEEVAPARADTGNEEANSTRELYNTGTQRLYGSSEMYGAERNSEYTSYKPADANRVDFETQLRALPRTGLVRQDLARDERVSDEQRRGDERGSVWENREMRERRGRVEEMVRDEQRKYQEQGERKRRRIV